MWKAVPAVLICFAWTTRATAAALKSPDHGEGIGVTGPAQPGLPGHLVVPDSSIEKPADIGKRSHTNVEIYIPGRRDDGAPRSAPGQR